MKADVGKQGGIAAEMTVRHLGGTVNGGAAGFALALSCAVVTLVGQFARIASDLTIVAWAGDDVGAKVAFSFLAVCAVLFSFHAGSSAPRDSS